MINIAAVPDDDDDDGSPSKRSRPTVDLTTGGRIDYGALLDMGGRRADEVDVLKKTAYVADWSSSAQTPGRHDAYTHRHRQTMRQVMALLAARNGYEHTTRTAIDTLAQLAEVAMADVALRTGDMVAHSHRTQAMHYDVLTAIGMRREVGRPSKLKSFAEYAMNAVKNGRRYAIQRVPQPPHDTSVQPPFRTRTEQSTTNMPGAPSWLPALPDAHTYKSTFVNITPTVTKLSARHLDILERRRARDSLIALSIRRVGERVINVDVANVTTGNEVEEGELGADGGGEEKVTPAPRTIQVLPPSTYARPVYACMSAGRNVNAKTVESKKDGDDANTSRHDQLTMDCVYFRRPRDIDDTTSTSAVWRSAEQYVSDVDWRARKYLPTAHAALDASTSITPSRSALDSLMTTRNECQRDLDHVEEVVNKAREREMMEDEESEMREKDTFERDLLSAGRYETMDVEEEIEFD